jgi:predicted DNA-binding transcriptional regulator YafY
MNHDYEKLLSRLMEILRRLYEGQKLSVKALADEFGVSDRTIQRDFNERLKSFPLAKSGRRWQIRPGYRVEKAAMLEDQLLLELLEALAAGVGPTFKKRTDALFGRLKAASNLPFYARIPLEPIGHLIGTIHTIESAIDRRVAVRFHYEIAGRVQSIMTQPIQMENNEGLWYLFGLDPAMKMIKRYRLSLIQNIEAGRESFKVPRQSEKLLDEAISGRFDQSAKPFEVRLLASAEMADQIAARPLNNSQKILDRRSDGALEIALKITHTREILPIVGYWLPHLKILSPDSLIEQMENLIKRWHDA